MTFGQAISTVFSKYAEFTGTARRSEYWWWTLFSALVSLATSTVDAALFGGVTVLSLLWGLAAFVPSLAVGVRRLRDAGYSWAFLLMVFIPLAGPIIVIVLLCQPTRVSAEQTWAPVLSKARDTST